MHISFFSERSLFEPISTRVKIFFFVVEWSNFSLVLPAHGTNKLDDVDCVHELRGVRIHKLFSSTMRTIFELKITKQKKKKRKEKQMVKRLVWVFYTWIIPQTTTNKSHISMHSLIERVGMADCIFDLSDCLFDWITICCLLRASLQCVPHLRLTEFCFFISYDSGSKIVTCVFQQRGNTRRSIIERKKEWNEITEDDWWIA